MSNTTNRHHHHPLQAALSSPTSRPQGFVPPARPFVLVPLYIYPAPGAWDPLFAAAEARPELDFWVVANPANGPGDGALPDANYVRELARLTALRNVKVVGYVHCSYGQRAAEDIVADVEAYGRWEGEMSVRGVEGEVSFFFSRSRFLLSFCAPSSLLLLVTEKCLDVCCGCLATWGDELPGRSTRGPGVMGVM